MGWCDNEERRTVAKGIQLSRDERRLAVTFHSGYPT
jgi:hypothetical protein